MNQLWDKVIKFFTKPPQLYVGFYISSNYICGMNFSTKEKRIIDTYSQSLPNGIINPSLNERNIIEKEILKEEFSKALDKMLISHRNIAFILPEMSQKTFTFSFDSLPSSPREREKIIHFRIKKRMPFLPEDAKISYDIFANDSGIKSVVNLARTYIIKEYEEFFSQFGLTVRTIVPPSVGLINLLNFESRENCFLLNVEQDSFSLLVFRNSEIILYRQKKFSFEHEEKGTMQDKIEDVFQEVENTLNFIDQSEDSGEMKFWIRSGMSEPEKILEKVNDKFDFSLVRIGSYLDFDISLEEAERLSPILGILL